LYLRVYICIYTYICNCVYTYVHMQMHRCIDTLVYTQI